MTIRRRPPLFAVAVGAVVLLAALWLVALTHRTGDSGSLDSRAAAVGATVRCPVCPEGIPLNDIAGQPADEMRGFIRAQLQRGESEDMVRGDLVGRYGASILLAPPQRGFDALAWFVPLLVVAACAVALLFSLRGWVSSAARATMPGPKGPWQGTDPEGSTPGPEGRGQGAGMAGPEGRGQGADPEGSLDGGDEGRRYEELLDRELLRRG